MTSQPTQVVLIVAAMLALGGCTTIEYPDVRQISGTAKNLPDLLTSTAIPMREEYAQRLQTLTGNLGRSATFNIADGAALAFSALADANTYFLRFFGLTGGVNLAVDTTFNNNAQAEIYESGLKALGCMIRTAQGIPTGEEQAKLNAALSQNSTDTLKQKIVGAQAAMQESIATGTGNQEGKPAGKQDGTLQPQLDAKQLAQMTALNTYGEKVAAMQQNSEAAQKIPLADKFATNLMELDLSVRSKIRKTVKSPTYTGIRDDLFKNIAEAEKARGQATDDKAELKIVGAQAGEKPANITLQQAAVQAATDMKTFDADLQKCIATAGL